MRDVRESERADGVDRIWMPGEIEHYRRIDRERDGIPLPQVLVDDLNGFAAELGAPAFVPVREPRSAAVNDKVYIHEFIDIIGHQRANYMHHMTAN